MDSLKKEEIKNIVEYHKNLHGKNIVEFAVVDHCVRHIRGTPRNKISEYVKELLKESTEK